MVFLVSFCVLLGGFFGCYLTAVACHFLIVKRANNSPIRTKTYRYLEYFQGWKEYGQFCPRSHMRSLAIAFVVGTFAFRYLGSSR